MSKFYTRLLLIVLGALMPLAADAAQVTLNIDNPEAISLQMGYSGPIEAKSQTVIEYDADSYPSLYISTMSGYKATVVDQDGNNYPAYYGNITLYLNAGTDGNVIYRHHRQP